MAKHSPNDSWLWQFVYSEYYEEQQQREMAKTALVQQIGYATETMQRTKDPEERKKKQEKIEQQIKVLELLQSGK